MLDELIGSLKDQVGDSLKEKIGLDQSQSDNSINAAASSVGDLLGGDGLDMGDVLNLFSKNDNTSGADNLVGQLSENFMGKLTGEVGLASEQAGGVKDMLLPMLMNLVSDKVGGDQNMLSGLVGGLLGGAKGGVGSLLGGAAKLFGK